MKIKIEKSANADTRTCDVSKVSKDELLKNSQQHIADVIKGLVFFQDKMGEAAIDHDRTKLSSIDQFYDDFTNGFKDGHQEWWNMHQDFERHHLKNNAFVQDDVNLIDILELITDGVMAGMARSGEYRKEELPDGLLQKAFDNTIKLLLDQVEVI